MSMEARTDNSYYLISDTVGLVSSVPISLDRYEKLKQSNTILSAALSLEERYELVLGNYIAFERLMVELSVENMSRSKWHIDDHYYADAFKERMSINRHIINILTSTKMYMDQTIKDIRSCIQPDEIAKEYFKKITGEHYDKHFEYRFMEQLRNHVQHHGFPVSMMSAQTKVKQQDEGCTWHYFTTVSTLKRELLTNTKLKKSVLAEMPEKIELGSAMRVYIASISDIQDQVRNLVNPHITTARDDIEEVFSKFPDADIQTDAIYVSHRQGPTLEHTEVGWFRVMLMHDDIRIRLQNLNEPLDNLPRRTATCNYL